jgi:hypothetical protein
MIEERRPANQPSYHVAICYAELGEKAKALTLLNELYENRDPNVTRIKIDPRLDPLRSDPRFADLMRRVGLAQ